ncbi:cytochrome c oxidase assembly protein [Flocculibacter collagenilyticus]|uniref:cytochrome c oxidase assembly protein n=1 Tax=Flocculibacter collagenilyticus TaxID=2744479 RepID=UPI0018F63E7B|nr:cytochrome c oxidase assembly protein [Flocculibacter collagenilyticus]
MTQDANTKLVKKLVLITIGMFGFGFALVPLYDVFCDITGLNGKTSTIAANAADAKLNTSRQIEVQFIARNHQGIPWQFSPKINKVDVHPGEIKQVDFFAHNLSSKNIVGQAVPSVSPGIAAGYFNKIECFCFFQQPLLAGDETLMPLKFYIDADIPDSIHTITLSYTLYDITDSLEKDESEQLFANLGK